MSIDLKTEAFEREQEKINFGKALPIVVGVFVVLLASYGALLFLVKDTEKRISFEQEKYAKKEAEFKSGNAREVLDFQNRLSESKNLFGSYVDGVEILSGVEKNMLPGVYLDSLKFDAKNGILELVCLAGSFDQVAKQILSFKKSNLFSRVDAGESDILEQEGRISFPVKLTLVREDKN